MQEQIQNLASSGMASDTYPIFVVSLSDSEERRESISSMMGRLRLGFEFFDAVDGRNGIPPEMESKIDRGLARTRKGRSLSDGEIACALSHAAIYEHIVSSLSGAVILEDDALVGDAFAEFVRDKHYLAKGWMILGYGGARVYRGGESMFAGHKVCQLAYPPYLTVGYSVSREVAEILADSCNPVSHVADWPIPPDENDAYAVCPCIVGHSDKFSSSLDDDRGELHRTPKKRGKSPGRILKMPYWTEKMKKKFLTRALPDSPTTEEGLANLRAD